MSTEGIPLRDAARQLGLHLDTVRRRVRAGTLPHYRDAKGRIMIPVDALHHAEPTPAPTPAQDAVQDAHSAVIDALQGIIATLREELEARRQEISELHQLLGVRQLQPGNRPWWKLWGR